MAEPTYFQWQNKFLLETIYPRRNRKLADFLIYCREIELWEEFKDKELTEEEVRAYREDRDRAVITAYKSYKTEYEYFQKGDVRTAYMGKYQLQDETELAPLKELHSIFQKNLTDRQTVRREKVLVAYYVTLWQQRIQSKEEEIKRLERRLAIMHPEHSDRTVIDQQIKRLKDVTLGPPEPGACKAAYVPFHILTRSRNASWNIIRKERSRHGRSRTRVCASTPCAPLSRGWKQKPESWLLTLPVSSLPAARAV